MAEAIVALPMSAALALILNAPIPAAEAQRHRTCPAADAGNRVAQNDLGLLLKAGAGGRSAP